MSSRLPRSLAWDTASQLWASSPEVRELFDLLDARSQKLGSQWRPRWTPSWWGAFQPNKSLTIHSHIYPSYNFLLNDKILNSNWLEKPPSITMDVAMMNSSQATILNNSCFYCRLSCRAVCCYSTVVIGYLAWSATRSTKSSIRSQNLHFPKTRATKEREINANNW